MQDLHNTQNSLYSNIYFDNMLTTFILCTIKKKHKHIQYISQNIISYEIFINYLFINKNLVNNFSETHTSFV